jgi:hypothetical protein
VTTPAEMTEGVYTHIVKLPDNLDFQGQVFICCNFLFQFWEGFGSRELLDLLLVLLYFLC